MVARQIHSHTGGKRHGPENQKIKELANREKTKTGRKNCKRKNKIKRVEETRRASKEKEGKENTRDKVKIARKRQGIVESKNRERKRKKIK